MEDVPAQVPKYFEIGPVDSWQAEATLFHLVSEPNAIGHSWQAEATLLHLLFAGHGFQMVAFRVDYLITVQ